MFRQWLTKDLGKLRRSEIDGLRYTPVRTFHSSGAGTLFEQTVYKPRHPYDIDFWLPCARIKDF